MQNLWSLLLSYCEHTISEQSEQPKLRSCHTHAVNHRIPILHENFNLRGDATSGLESSDTRYVVVCACCLSVKLLQMCYEFASNQRWKVFCFLLCFSTDSPFNYLILYNYGCSIVFTNRCGRNSRRHFPDRAKTLTGELSVCLDCNLPLL